MTCTAPPHHVGLVIVSAMPVLVTDVRGSRRPVQRHCLLGWWSHPLLSIEAKAPWAFRSQDRDTTRSNVAVANRVGDVAGKECVLNDDMSLMITE